MLKDFRFALFQFILSPLEGWDLPNYLGATLRGGFGYAFKKTCCPLRNECRERCSFPERCVYSYIFETPPPKETEVMRKYPFAPHPFIIEPPLENKREGPLTFGLTLVGKSIDYLPYFLYTFEELGRMGLGRRRSKFYLQEVRNGDGEVIYEGKEKVLTRDFKLQSLT